MLEGDRRQTCLSDTPAISPETSRCRCSSPRFLHFRRVTDRQLTTRNMAASSDRNPPPFPTADEPEAGAADMADGDSDEGEDIFVNNVRGRFVCSARLTEVC